MKKLFCFALATLMLLTALVACNNPKPIPDRDEAETGDTPKDETPGDEKPQPPSTDIPEQPPTDGDTVGSDFDGIYDPSTGHSTFDQDESEIHYVIEDLPTDSAKYIAIELYDAQKNELVARLCLTAEKNAEQLTQFETLWGAHLNEPIKQASSDKEYYVETRFRAVVYINGMYTQGAKGFRYLPDAAGALWSFASGQSDDAWQPMYFRGGEEVAAFVNQIMNQRIGIKFK